MLGNNFFVPGRAYRVITPRLDTRHYNHYFEIGDKIICRGVIRANAVNELKGGRWVPRRGPSEFRKPHLRGAFIGPDGLDQTLATGDVVAWRD